MFRRFSRIPSRLALPVATTVALSGCIGTAETVQILRDRYGVPNIFARTPEGACFGAGYAQAQDRLHELLMQYRRAAGTMAEVFGEEYLADDFKQRLWGHAEVSRRRYMEIAPRSRAMMEAFLGGVELYMRENPFSVPPWAPELEPWMVVALGRYIIWGWPEGDAGRDLLNAGIRPDPIEPRGSNQWVVSGERTAVGAPIALVDPHLGWYGRFRFYESRLYAGELQVAGVSVLGAPIPSLGHSRHASVAMTTGGPDAADVYEITLDPRQPGRYLYDGEWRDLEKRELIVRVLRDGKAEYTKRTLLSTHHGPIVAHKDGKGYAMKIPYAEEVGLMDQIYAMMTARNLDEMKDALARFQLMEQNVMIATVDGDIYYVRNGRVPIRPAGFDWTRPVPGDTSKSEWLGIHPLDDLVQALNPPQGYMQNCNVSPAVMMVDSPMVPERYQERPYLFNEGHPYLHQRASQTRKELHAERRMTIERAVEIAHSTTVYNAALWQARLEAASADAGGELRSEARDLLKLILDWNGRADRDSVGAVAYLYWKQTVYEIDAGVPPEFALRGETRLGAVALLADRLGLEPPPIEPPDLIAALDGATSKMLRDWNDLEVPFGRIFQVGRKGSPRRFPIGGGSIPGLSTPRALGFEKQSDSRTHLAVSGQTATQIIVLSDPPRSYSLLPLGESDDPDSPHFDDQAEKLMQHRRLKPTYFLDREKLLENVESSVEIRYRKKAPWTSSPERTRPVRGVE